ncbi:hydrogenase expression protein HupH [Bathymodiolus thermophilus thioautotrophic gill symbiont]|uniref:Hydrogenase expression protein HupH n=1 Tax=Bathymodiolus thermophilus thioautotrophic gill symbiont TaxID=2360 RepID=A0A3G3IPF2_9GAMM|nr:hydrogenase expression/formation protein [Bathymodiolus thermophilus thioautotrophic gill symbiont]AYQ57681.1 hydrogenase expression protein HupH [Bathymodiolus thermophilus thioautotrophic gill symbiont]
MSSIPVPPIPANFLGAGSQTTSEEDTLEYMQMPTEMSTFDIDSKIYAFDENINLSECRVFLENIYTQLAGYDINNDNLIFEVTGLNAENLDYLNTLLGEGEVSAVIKQKHQIVNIQESIFTGIWRVTVVDNNNTLLQDYIEAGNIPEMIVSVNQEKPGKVLFNNALLPDGVVNVPAILTELKDKRKTLDSLGDIVIDEMNNPIEAINLTLLPHTEEDLACINNILGAGDTVILSRGYGNCRIVSTGTSSIWWVKYFNSTDNEILSTIEVVKIPIVACAAQEDIESSVERLKEFADEL